MALLIKVLSCVFSLNLSSFGRQQVNRTQASSKDLTQIEVVQIGLVLLVDIYFNLSPHDSSPEAQVGSTDSI